MGEYYRNNISFDPDPNNGSFLFEVFSLVRGTVRIPHDGETACAQWAAYPFLPRKFVVASVQTHLFFSSVGQALPCEGRSRATKAVFLWGHCLSVDIRNRTLILRMRGRFFLCVGSMTPLEMYVQEARLAWRMRFFPDALRICASFFSGRAAISPAELF